MERICSGNVMTVVSRSLNLIDKRLVDHGVRVMLVLNDMLQAEGCRDREVRKTLQILALLHDVGAYRTEEIGNMLRFETGNVWAHSIYGYLFLREFTPLGELAKAVLYHHADCDDTLGERADVRRFSQLIHTADRAVVWHDELHRPAEELERHLLKKQGTQFSPESVELFLDASRRLGTMEKLERAVALKDEMDFDAISGEEAAAYLTMVVHAIDFRSRVTATHTVGVKEISVRLGRKLGLPEQTLEQLRRGALLHDLGKIGTPLSILEKPGRLTGEEMAVMRDHVVLSGEVIEGVVDETVARIALRHHEKLDGSGYPLGLTAAELTLPERVLAVADIVSALDMSRSYKDAYPKERCVRILEELRDRGKLDRAAVDAMTGSFDEIMGQANQACGRIRDVYERLSAEYGCLLREHGVIQTQNALQYI